MVTLHSQAQMRDLSGFVETRQQLLTLKPNHRMNWIGFSVAHHLNSKYDLNLYWIIFSQMETAIGLGSFIFIFFVWGFFLCIVYVLDTMIQYMQFVPIILSSSFPFFFYYNWQLWGSLQHEFAYLKVI